MTTLTPRSGRWQWLGPSLGLLAGLAYLLTLSNGAFPGESASLVAQSAGLVPKLTTLNPLWHLFAWVLVHIPIGAIAMRLNLFSALCGAAVVWLLYNIVSETIYEMIDDVSTDRSIASAAARAAGTCAALFLAFCIPFWYVSNRAHTAPFDILLVLVVASLFAGYVRDLSEKKILLVFLICGLGTVEFATFILLEPILFICLLAVLWAKKQLKISLLLKIAACFAAGLLLYLFSAIQFYLSDSRDLIESKNVLEVILTTWRMQYFLIAHSLPKQGWILVALMGIIPWLACVLVARRGLNGENEWGMYILHAAMTAVAFASLFNIKIAPWRLLGTRTVMVTPYLLMAMVYGYLVAYWYLLLKTIPLVEEDPGQAARRKWFGVFVLAPAIGAVCIAPLINFSEADARPAKAINQYARSVIECMGQRTWLVSDGEIQDSVLMLAANDMRVHIVVLDASEGNSDPYMRYVARFFTTPRLKSLTEVGMIPLLLEWFAGDHEIGDKVAMFSMADQLLSAGLISFPDRAVFLGTRDMSKIDVDELLRRNRTFWDATVPMLREAEKVRCPTVPMLAADLLRHTSLMADDLGVALADLGRTNDAFTAYAKAREIYPGNVSALLNQYTMLKEGYKTDLAGDVEKEIGKLMNANKVTPISYSRSVLYFGDIRAPQILANSGHPAKAVAGTKKPIDLNAAKSDRRKESLALSYLIHSQEDDNEAVYRELAAKNKNDGAPLLGLSRISARKGDYKEAATLIDQAEQRGVSKAEAGFARAELCLMSGDIDKARSVLEDLANTNPNLPHAWGLLATVLLRQGDTASAEMDRCVKRLSDMKNKDFFATVVLGQIAMARNDAATAHKQFDLALTIKPTAIPVMELLLKLDLSSGQHDATTEYIRRILSLDPGHTFANYVLGCMQIERQEYELAENSLRRSLETEKTAPALNDLAWLLSRKGEYGEAEKLARDAIEMNDKLYQAYDTLGVIMMKSKRLDEAEKTFSKALSIYDGNPDVQMNMAELQAAKGNKTQALKIIGKLAEKRTQFSEESQQRMDELARQFRNM